MKSAIATQGWFVQWGSRFEKEDAEYLQRGKSRDGFANLWGAIEVRFCHVDFEF